MPRGKAEAELLGPLRLCDHGLPLRQPRLQTAQVRDLRERRLHRVVLQQTILLDDGDLGLDHVANVVHRELSVFDDRLGQDLLRFQERESGQVPNQERDLVPGQRHVDILPFGHVPDDLGEQLLVFLGRGARHRDDRHHPVHRVGEGNTSPGHENRSTNTPKRLCGLLHLGGQDGVLVQVWPEILEVVESGLIGCRDVTKGLRGTLRVVHRSGKVHSAQPSDTSPGEQRVVETIRHVEEKRGDPLLLLGIEMQELVPRTDQEHQVVNRIDLAHVALLDRCSTRSNAAARRCRPSSSSGARRAEAQS